LANKKKKKKTGARRATYARGKPVDPQKNKAGARPSGMPRAAGAGATTQEPGAKPASVEKGAPASGQWNVIRAGTLEMKMFQVIVLVLVVAVFIQYPLWSEIANRDYKDALKKYPVELKKWEQKYTTDKARKANESSKPAKPKKPTFSDFLIIYAFFPLLESLIFAFIGLNAARRTDLKMPILEKYASKEAGWADIRDLLAYGVPAGLVVLAPLVGLSFFSKAQGFSKTVQVQFATWKDALYYASFSIQNQMIFVLLAMSALVWVCTRYRERLKVEPYWPALAGATVLGFLYFFNLSRTGAEKTVVSLVTGLLVALALVGVTGYLYWKKGLEYSLLAGAVGFAVYPFIASLIIK